MFNCLDIGNGARAILNMDGTYTRVTREKFNDKYYHVYIPQHDTLMCCVREGPIWEGNLPSKVERDQLHALGLIHPIVVKDEEGFWGANYTARRVLAVVENRRKERKGD